MRFFAALALLALFSQAFAATAGVSLSVYAPAPVPPTWRLQSQNSSAPDYPAAVALAAYWTDDAFLSSYVFSTNESGQWVNGTPEVPSVWVWEEGEAGAAWTEGDGCASPATFWDGDWGGGFSAGCNLFVNFSKPGGAVAAKWRVSAGAWNSVNGTNLTVAPDCFGQPVLQMKLTNYFANPQYSRAYCWNGTGYALLDSAAGAVAYESGMWVQTLVNESWSNYTWSNASVLPGTVVGWRAYANDTSGDWNATGVMAFAVSDAAPPKHSGQAQNTSTPQYPAAVALSAYWTDNYLLSSFTVSTNETGAFVNKTLQPMTGTANWSNYTWSNSSVQAGAVVGWRIYANDSSGNWNATPVSAFTVSAVTWCGNSACDHGETCSSCQADCGVCPATGSFFGSRGGEGSLGLVPRPSPTPAPTPPPLITAIPSAAKMPSARIIAPSSALVGDAFGVRVVDENGAPVAGVRVEIVSQSGVAFDSGPTDASGFVSIAIPGAGLYSLRQTLGFYATEVPVLVAAKQAGEPEGVGVPTNEAEQGTPATPLGVDGWGVALFAIAACAIAAFLVMRKNPAKSKDELKRKELFETLEEMRKRQKLEELK